MANTRTSRRWILGALIGAVVLTITIPARAQSNDEIQTGTQFNLSVPGARSLAMGGAFLAAADDATAAYANPAGLTRLSRPEVSLEGRAWTFRSLFVERGHLPETELTGLGVDVVDGLEMGEIEDDTAGPSFVSYVHTGDRWAIAVYRHQLARFEASLHSQGPFVGRRNNLSRVAPARSHLELEIVNTGLAAAFRPLPALSLGLGVSWFDFELDSRTERFLRASATGDFFTDIQTGSFFGPANFKPANLLNEQVQRGNDSTWAANAGWLWTIDHRWSLGGVYRQGPEFDFVGTFRDGPVGERPGEIDPTLGGRGTFHVPDIYGLGVAFRPVDTMLFTFDWERVEYSDMADDLLNLLRAAEPGRDRFVVDDADELHLGFEVQHLGFALPLALRLGAWYDPDHRIRYEGPSDNLLARFRAGQDEIHWTAGFGLVAGRTQVDLALDLSDRVDTYSASIVRRF